MVSLAPLDAQLKFLIVDDMPAMRMILRGMIEDAGFSRIVEADQGDDAWQQLQSLAADPAERIDVLILDWNLPGMSGVDLLRAVRAFDATRELPVVMVTSLGSESAIAEAMSLGVSDYFVKPFTPDQFVVKLRKLLEGYSSSLAARSRSDAGARS